MVMAMPLLSREKGRERRPARIEQVVVPAGVKELGLI